jgi:cephalosporin hydroxylase
MKTLKEIFARIGNHSGVDIGCNDKDGIHTYVDTYDKLFAPFQKGCSFMEIGLAMGDSIDLFDEYFDNSEIVGVDISVVFPPKKYKNEVAIIEADATKANFLKAIEFKTFDIIIDDASHVTQDQLDTFNLLRPYMKKGSIYIIEDILAWDIEKHKFNRLHDNIEVIDMRSNGRFDNMLLIFRF